MSGGRSAEARARALRAGARKGLWRRLLAALGLNPAAARADARAAMWAHGAAGEEATARLLTPLTRRGWTVWHDMRLERRQFNLDHVLASPCGTALVVLDTKRWDRRRPTRVVRGRVCCGWEDRHQQVEKVAGYAGAVAAAVGLPEDRVWPMLVVHGSPVDGGALWAPVGGVHRRCLIVGPHALVPALRGAPRGRDARAAAVLVARANRVLRPYVNG